MFTNILDNSPYAWEVSGWLWDRKHGGDTTLNAISESISIETPNKNNEYLIEMMRIHVGPEYAENDLNDRLDYAKAFYDIIK